jgi:hypothetical protein
MTAKVTAIAFGLGMIGVSLPLFGADSPQGKGPKQSFEVTSTERVPFQPGGTIRFDHSYGYLSVEGWDEPEVEVTVTKSTNRFDEPEHKAKAEQRFAQIGVVTQRRSDQEVATTTTLPVRTGFFSTVLPLRKLIVIRSLPPSNERGVTVEYRVRVPRDSRLVVHHDNGYVWVSDVTGDIEVNSHTGDMIVMLPDPGPYSIDARTRLGRISSDFTGSENSSYLIGSHFAYASQGQSRNVHLRMGRGSVTIKKGPPAGPFWKN